MYTNFITQNPGVHQYYMGLAIQYNHFGEQGDYENQEAIGTEIFNLIMPHAQQVDSRLLHWIPKEVLEQFEINFESDGFHIKDWRQIDEDDPSNSGHGAERGLNSSSHNKYHHKAAAGARLGESSSEESGGPPEMSESSSSSHSRHANSHL